jgi:hypothetical protein
VPIQGKRPLAMQGQAAHVSAACSPVLYWYGHRM